MMKSLLPTRLLSYLFTALLMALLGTSVLQAQSMRAKVITRVFWQDRETDKLSYADLVTTNKWSIKRGWVNGFPELDADKQDLVQMKECAGVLMVGVRDHEDGKFQSGWVAVDTGVFEEPHGNHTHWKYTRAPAVKQSKLDADQGNPAHLYVYDRQFYLANDTKNGFTKASPLNLKNGVTNAAAFFPGGGNHITMAAVNNSVVYSTWMMVKATTLAASMLSARRRLRLRLSTRSICRPVSFTERLTTQARSSLHPAMAFAG